MIPFQFNIDIIEELEKALPSYKLVTTQFIINELKGLSRNKKGKTRVNAKLALKYAKKRNIQTKNIPLQKNETVDDALIRVSEVIATNDIELKKKAKNQGKTIVYLRQKRYVMIDGHL